MTKASRELHFISPELIIIPEDRQRKMELDIGDIIGSIRQRGILLPLLLLPDHTLIAGWRRLKTALFLKMKEVPYRIIEGNASELEIQIIELEENLRRKDLTWQDKAAAILKIHNLHVKEDAEWTVEQTAMSMNYDEKHIYKMIDLGEEIEAGNTSVIQAETIANATTILSRRRSRATDEAIQRIMEQPKGATATPRSAAGARLLAGVGGMAPEDAGDPATDGRAAGDGTEGVHSLGGDGKPEESSPYAIVAADFTQWLADYDGPKFNLLHADLPYGVELNEQANQDAFEGGGYESNPEIYWRLTNALLDSWDRFMFPSAHIMFWIAKKFEEETRALFLKKLAHVDARINDNLLIWHKTDNRGILADPLRGPRNIGEYALLISTGDRKIVKPVANIYGAPTAKAEAIHTNEKPEPMLRHFLSMLVDGHSRVLDPTAGSGSAVRVAESLDAEAALGLELNPDFAERAQVRLLKARGLRNLSSLIAKEEKEPTDGE